WMDIARRLAIAVNVPGDRHAGGLSLAGIRHLGGEDDGLALARDLSRRRDPIDRQIGARRGRRVDRDYFERYFALALIGGAAQTRPDRAGVGPPALRLPRG